MTAPAGPAFTETEIRPDELRAEQAALFAADVARLRRHEAEFVEVGCPACGADEHEPAFETMGFRWVACGRCSTRYVARRPRPEHLREYYETSENYRFWAERIFPATEAVRRERIFVPRVDRLLSLVERHDVGRDRLIEVGAGFGTFCQELVGRSAFHEVVAVEPTPDLAARCRRLGLHVVAEPVEEAAESLGEADVVASFETIEHLFEPSAFLGACAAIVRPGGLLVLSCPNGLGFDVLELGAASDAVDPEHLNLFNPASLGILVERHGFVTVEVTTPGELDAELVRKKALAGEWAVPSPFLTTVLLDEWDRLGGAFQRFLASSGLSSHMWLVARRVP